MQEIIEYIDALLNEEYSRLEIIESLISEFGSEYPDYDYSKWREIVKTRIEETKGNKDDEDGYTSIPIQSLATIDGLQKKFIECALAFNTSRTQWHAYMDSLISKHGMPYLYVGSVNYMHDHEYDFISVINEIKEFSEEEKSIRLQREIDFLKKWKFPGTYSVAFFAFGGWINICGDAYRVDRVKSYNISRRGENVIYSIKINRASVKEVSIPSDDVRSNIEMKALLEACLNISFGRTTFKSDGDIEGYLESNIDESIIKFEGISLAHPRKEFIYAINDLAAEKKSISILSYDPGWAIIKNEYVGYPIEWRFYISGKGYVFEHLRGCTDDFIGYNKTREAYDKLVVYFTSILGEPTEVEDVPIDVHKNSIFKLLREGEYTIETTYDKDDIYATVELQVYDEDGEKKVGYVDIYIKDYRLDNINML